jgi:hypothetical protein
MSTNKRNSIEIKVSYDRISKKYTINSDLKAIFNKARKAFQIKLPSGKFLLVKPDDIKNKSIENAVGIDDESENIRLIEPKRSPIRVSTSK